MICLRFLIDTFALNKRKKCYPEKADLRNTMKSAGWQVVTHQRVNLE